MKAEGKKKEPQKDERKIADLTVDEFMTLLRSAKPVVAIRYDPLAGLDEMRRERMRHERAMAEIEASKPLSVIRMLFG